MLKEKSPDELAEDGPRGGNRKLVTLKARHGPRTLNGNYINFNFEGEYARLTELHTRDQGLSNPILTLISRVSTLDSQNYTLEIKVCLTQLVQLKAQTYHSNWRMKMKIDNEPKLDFDDVLIVPQRSSVGSRRDVNLKRKFKFYHSQKQWYGTPIMASNMVATGTFSMSAELMKYGI
jgi:hypothetical protein